MNICVVGAGYVGLVTGLCLAERGHDVNCVDIDASRIARLAAGELPVSERGLDDLLLRHLGHRFVPTTDLTAAVLRSELTMIAVGTPLANGAICLRFVEQAAAAIGRILAIKDEYHVVIVKSTVVPGTTGRRVRTILEGTSGKRAGVDFGLGMNPEFLREGDAVEDFQKPDRIVLGAIDVRSMEQMRQLYADFEGVRYILTNPQTAEMIKYASNSLLATLISFSNEIGNLCSVAPDVDVMDVLDAVHADKRISPTTADGHRIVPPVTTYLKAGCGFGGSCFPKDVRALIQWGAEHKQAAPLLTAVLHTNAQQPREVIALLKKHFPDVAGVHVAVLGLAFKAGTDDVRESPAFPVIMDLRTAGARVVTYDPMATSAARLVLGDQNLRYAMSVRDAIAGVDAIIVITAWPEFQQLPSLLEGLENPPVVIDGRRVFDKTRVRRYEGIGLGRADDCSCWFAPAMALDSQLRTRTDRAL